MCKGDESMDTEGDSRDQVKAIKAFIPTIRPSLTHTLLPVVLVFTGTLVS